MRFYVWFRIWLRSFCNLFSFHYRKPKSTLQRKRERERRLKAKHTSAKRYRTKKKYKKRRSSTAVRNQKLLSSLFGFIGASLAILLLPIGLLDWGHKSAKAKRASAKSGASKKITAKPDLSPASSPSKKASTQTPQKKPAASPSRTVAKAAHAHEAEKPSPSIRVTPIPSPAHPEAQATIPAKQTPTVTEPDENTPKSTPKNEKDQYIRKRMIIAGSCDCDKAVFDRLEVGAFIDLEVETDNPHDKSAVKLLFRGQKIGYIAKKDKLTFVTCLQLKRHIYGIITAVFEEDGQTKYEYETWFECE